MKSHVPLSELLDALESGSRPKGGVAEISAGVPSVGGEHLDGKGGFNFKNLRYVPEEFYEKMPRGKIRSGDILLVKDGATTGKISFVGRDFPLERAAVNEHVFILRSKLSRALPKFLFYFLAGPLGQKRLMANFHGAAIGGINSRFVDNVIVPGLSLSQQQKVVDALDAADELRKLRSQAERRSEELVPAIFYDMFGDPVTNPKRWPKVPLSELISPDDKINYGVVQPGDHLDEGIPIIRVGDFSNGRVEKARLKRIRPDIEAQYERSRLKGNEVLVACVGSIGEIALADMSLRGFNIARAIARVPPGELVLQDFLGAYLNTDFVKSYFQNQTRTVTQPTLNIRQIKETPTFLPPRYLQVEFASRTEEAREIKIKQNESTIRIDWFFQSLLHRAFEGEL